MKGTWRRWKSDWFLDHDYLVAAVVLNVLFILALYEIGIVSIPNYERFLILQPRFLFIICSYFFGFSYESDQIILKYSQNEKHHTFKKCKNTTYVILPQKAKGPVKPKR